MRQTRSRLRNRIGMTVCVATLVVLLTGGRAAADYRIAPGDTIEVAVAAAPDLRYRAAVQLDGSVSIPGVGVVAVTGLTPAELQVKMQAILPTRVLKYRAIDGRERPLLVRPADVTASVIEYRPVYVTGDVLTPGAQPYRPLMTIRQVVAVAGGYSMLRARSAQAGADPVELQKDYETIAIDYTKNLFRVSRIEAELAGKDRFDAGIARGLPAPAALIAATAKSEANILRVALAERSAERLFLEDAIKKSLDQLAILKKQQEGEAKGLEFDEQDLERVLKLFSAGSSTNPRVMESRRAVLLSSTRKLQTTAEIMRISRQQDEFRRQLDRGESEMRLKLLAEQNEAAVRLAELRTRLQAAAQKLHPLNVAGPAPVGMDSLRPEVTLMRKAGQAWTRRPVTEDLEVEPGDVIDVALRAGLTQAATN